MLHTLTDTQTDGQIIKQGDLTKRGTPPPQKKTLTKRGTRLFVDGDVHFLRQIDSKSKSAAFVELPGILPTIQNFFSFFPGCLAGERE